MRKRSEWPRETVALEQQLEATATDRGTTALVIAREMRETSDSPITQRSARELASLGDAVRELACGGTVEQIHVDVIEEWGPCTIAEVKRALADLADDGELVRNGAGWMCA